MNVKYKIKYFINRFSFIAMLCSFTLFYACEKTIQMDIKNDRRKIVVNGILTLQSTISVNISRSIHILDRGQPTYITDAQVLLFKNDMLIDTMYHTSMGNYSSHTIYPVINANYSVKVKANDLQDVEATDKIPLQIPILSIDTATTIFVGSGGPMGGMGEKRDMLQCKIKFHDIANEKNYYRLTIEAPSNDLYSNPPYFESDDPAITDFSSGNDALFDDGLFDGKTYELTIYLDNNTSGNVYFQLSSVSKSCYLYYKSMNKYSDANGNPFAEPVMVYTNVINGLGIFAGTAPSRQSIVIPNNNNFHPY